MKTVHLSLPASDSLVWAVWPDGNLICVPRARLPITTACVCKEWSDWDATCKPNDKGVCKTTRHCKKTNGSPECPATPATEDKDCPNYAGCSGMRLRFPYFTLPRSLRPTSHACCPVFEQALNLICTFGSHDTLLSPKPQPACASSGANGMPRATRTTRASARRRATA